MGEHSCWSKQSQREECSESHRYEGHLFQLIATEAAAACRAPTAAVQAVSTYITEGDYVGILVGLTKSPSTVGGDETRRLLGVGVLARVICLDDWSDALFATWQAKPPPHRVTSPSRGANQLRQFNRDPGAQWPDAP